MAKKEKGKKRLKKIDDFITAAYFVVMMLVLFCAGVFYILAYGIPLGNYEKDMNQVLTGIGMIGVVFFELLGIKIFNMYFEYLDRNQRDFRKEINPRKWPHPKMRTVNRTLTYMTRRVYLLVWDLLIGVLIFSAVVVNVYMMMDNKIPMDFGSILMIPIAFLIIWLLIRKAIVIFYYGRKYEKKMVYYSEKYVGIRDTEGFLKKLEKSLKEDLLYYSHQWIITKDYFMAYCDTGAFIHPIAIPVNEMVRLQYEVRTREVHTRDSRVTVDEAAVIICKLRSGKSVDLYVGDRPKIGKIWKVLEYFKIPYENKMNPNEHYVEPYEITVTDPASAESENVIVKNTTSIGGSSNLSGLESVIMGMDARDIEKVYQLLESGQKVIAIKEIREMTGLGLAEAKKIADNYQDFLGDRRN